MGDKRQISKYGLTVKLDKSQVFPEDPGQGTPAMVYTSGGTYSATYTCAVNEGELVNDRDWVQKLNDQQVEWLQSLESDIDEFLQW